LIIQSLLVFFIIIIYVSRLQITLFLITLSIEALPITIFLAFKPQPNLPIFELRRFLFFYPTTILI
jgi:hypothetical protein